MTRFVLGFFFLSGFTSLIYEVVWTRMLTLTLGSTVYAVSTILTLFMVGLAWGSYLVGRMADRYLTGSQNPLSPLVLYGLLEGAIGVYVLILPVFLGWAESAYLTLYTAFEPHFISAMVIRILVAAGLLLPPTVLMGATFPLMCLFLVRQKKRPGRAVGLVYGLNTAGAVTGTLAAGFFFIPMWGVGWTTSVGVAINMFICVSSIHLSRRREHTTAVRIDDMPAQSISTEEGPESSPLEILVKHDTPFALTAWRILLGVGLSGFALMAYEVLWTRVLLLVWPSTTYAFSIMLAVILGGMAAGSGIVSRSTDRLRSLSRVLCLVQIVMGCSALLGLIAFYFIRGMTSGGEVPSPSWGTAVTTMTLESVLLMVIPAFLAGAVYPLAGRLLLESNRSVLRSTGSLYAAGTVGGTFGAVLGGFVLIPGIGVIHAFALVAGINLISGLSFLFSRQPPESSIRILGRILDMRVVMGIATVFLVLMSVTLIYRPTELAADDRMFYYQDGTDATVIVYREASSQSLALRVNSQVMARTNHGAMVEQKLRGHLPVLIHSHPKAALQVGLGSGITLGSIATHPLNRVESVEISLKVIEAAHWFSDYNHNILSNPDVTIVEEDGRNHLLTTSNMYDVVISDSQPPWSAGIVNLYTEEYYRLVASHLRQDGIMSQVIPLYGLSMDQIKMVVRTFRSVFPFTTVWLTYGDLILLGQKSGFPINFTMFKKRLEQDAVDEDLKTIFRNSPYRILMSFIMGWNKVGEFVGKGPIITDSRPYIEFMAPKTLYQELRTENLAKVNRWREPITPYLTNSSEDERRWILTTQQADISLVEGQIAVAQNDLESAIQHLTEANQILPEDEEIRSLLSLSYFRLAKRYLERGLYGNARQHVEKAVILSPRFLSARYLYAKVLDVLSDKKAAMVQYRKIIRQDARSIEAYIRLGEILEQQGEYQKALEQYQRAIRMRMDDPQGYQHAARIRYRLGEFQKTADLLEYALTKDSEDVSMLYNLAETYEHFDCSRARKAWALFVAKAEETAIDQEQIKRVSEHLFRMINEDRPCSYS